MAALRGAACFSRESRSAEVISLRTRKNEPLSYVLLNSPLVTRRVRTFKVLGSVPDFFVFFLFDFFFRHPRSRCLALPRYDNRLTTVESLF